MQSFPGQSRRAASVAKRDVKPVRSSANAQWSRRQQLEREEKMRNAQIAFREAVAQCERNNREACGRGCWL